jgi:hypothetical protein
LAGAVESLQPVASVELNTKRIVEIIGIVLRIVVSRALGSFFLERAVSWGGGVDAQRSADWSEISHHICCEMRGFISSDVRMLTSVEVTLSRRSYDGCTCRII